MTHSKEDRIRERAHQIWEAAGRPHGHDTDHWDQASREIEDLERPPASPDIAGKVGLVVDKKAQAGDVNRKARIQPTAIDKVPQRPASKRDA